MTTLPIIKDCKKSDNSVNLLLHFSKNAEYFQGHFPQMAVLPGFVQVHFALTFAKEYLAVDQVILAIKKLRFTKIISPNSDINLTIEIISLKKITFKYFTKETNHSSGEIHFV